MKETVAVIGLGRVGLPLAAWFAKSGRQVFGVDNDRDRIESLQRAELPFHEDGLETLIKLYIGDRLVVTHDLSCISKCSTIILTLGTPVDEHLNPVFDQIDDVTEQLGQYLTRGQTVLLRSTLAPGTTERIATALQQVTGMQVGIDFFVAFCPERIAEGKALEEIPKIPQIVGGVDAESTLQAAKFFQSVGNQVLPSDAVSAELAKLFCNMYRYINFAVSNEFMMLADSYDRRIHEVLDLVNTNYSRANVPKPGFAAGPCLFKDGFFATDRLSFPDLFSTSWRINESMPNYLIQQIKQKTQLKGKTVALLGMTFKKDVDDIRNSLSFKMKNRLESEGVNLLLHDPYVAEGHLEKILLQSDIVIIAVNHQAYIDLGWKVFQPRLKPGALVCDLWNVFGKGRILFESDDEVEEPKREPECPILT